MPDAWPVVVDVAGDGRQGGAEVGWRLGPIRGGERDEEPVAGLGVKNSDADAVLIHDHLVHIP